MDRNNRLVDLAAAMIQDMSSEEKDCYILDRIFYELDAELSDDELIGRLEELGLEDVDYDEDDDDDDYKRNGFDSEAAFWSYKEG